MNRFLPLAGGVAVALAAGRAIALDQAGGAGVR